MQTTHNIFCAQNGDAAVGGASMHDVILGAGSTGLACARHLCARGHRVTVLDSRSAPPNAAVIQNELPQVDIHVGGFDAAYLANADRIVVSPGIVLTESFIVEARKRGISVVSDIDLFFAQRTAPVIGITGSNGKSTVTSWLGAVLNGAAVATRIGGNLGTPALELLAATEPDAYALELSSFQLERSAALPLRGAAVLNLSPDHLDHHASLDEYARAKARIFAAADVAVVCRSDRRLLDMAAGVASVVTFGDDEPQPGHYGLRDVDGTTWLAYGKHNLLDVRELKLFAHHDHVNALAVLALAQIAGVDWPRARDGLVAFDGLAHRMQLIGVSDDVRWVDDSKGTNVGATIAAAQSVTTPIVLIAGGDAKGADVSELAGAFAGRARAAVLLGKDARLLGDVLKPVCDVHFATDMTGAVRLAAGLARPGDTVLLSPACASLDMFENYAQRGREFAAAWRALS